MRLATREDLAAIAQVATAAGQAGDRWGGTSPAYVRHLMTVGRVVVAELAGSVVGFGAAEQIGAGPGPRRAVPSPAQA